MTDPLKGTETIRFLILCKLTAAPAETPNSFSQDAISDILSDGFSAGIFTAQSIRARVALKDMTSDGSLNR